MKFTAPLNKQSQRFLWKLMWKRRGHYVEPLVQINKHVRMSGIPVVDLAEEKQKEVKTPENPNDYRSESHKANTEWSNYNEETAYMFTKARRIMLGQNQACILTKTIPFDGFPASVQPLVGKVHVQNEEKLLQRYIMQSQVWDPTQERLPKRVDKEFVGYKFTAEYGIPKYRSTKILLRNLMRLCQNACVEYPSLLTDYRVLNDTELSSHYYFKDNLMLVKGSCNHLVLGNKPVGIFAGEDEVDKSVNTKLPNLFPVSPLINFQQTNNYTVESVAGLVENTETSHHHPHLLFIGANNFWSNEDRQNSALIQCFGHALVQARNQYGNDVTILPKPICVQCVNMDETTLNFTFFQLNTLDFSNQSGIKNFVWFDTSNKLFGKQLRQPWKEGNYETTQYSDFNPKPFHKLLTMYLSNTPEVYEDLESEKQSAVA